MTLEMCTCSEWIAADIASAYDVEAWQDEIAVAYCDGAANYLMRHGVPYDRAKGGRLLYHGWNGAHFRERIGIFGVFGDLTADERRIIEDADQIGRKDAEDFAESKASQESAEIEL